MPRSTLSRGRLHFEARSVRLIAAWTLAMGGLAPATQHLLNTRGTGASSPAPVTLASPGPALPPLSTRLPRP